ncbi:MAG: hypothetical protein ACE5HO_01215 [bacterium]
MHKRLNRMAVLACIFSAVFLLTPQRQTVYAQQTPDLHATIDSISQDIAKIRGLPFKHRVNVQKQSLHDFGLFLDRTVLQQMPELRLSYYGKIVKMLGLYRGPEIADFKSMAKLIMQSQAAAYYDPATNTFYVVMPDIPRQMLSTVYAHELYHGLQDQYFNLEQYLLSQTSGALNDDELLARQAVVEGEATYIMTLWSVEKMLGSLPQPSMLRMMIDMQAQMDTKKMLEILKSEALPMASESDVAKAVHALEDIPPFLVETLMGVYLKGMAFIFHIQQQGWQKVSQLYDPNRAPVSTEQILHAEKWLKQEKPFKYQWPFFENEATFEGWEVLDSNTIGEFQWRIIFSEYDMANVARIAADGWDGDSYAILKNSTSDDLILLLVTNWDTTKDAEEFATNYQALLKVKQRESPEPAKVAQENKEVIVVEGGREGSLDAMVAFVRKVAKSK